MTHALTVASTAIRQLDGLYSLNDLHAAAGGERQHQPSNFLRLDQTQALIAEIDKSSDVRISHKSTRGANGGTYVCRELVYAYANWISPAFYLKMIRAFDALQKPVLPAPAFDLRAALRGANSTPSVPLSAEVQAAINRKAWAMAHDAYELCREHLARRVAYTSEIGVPRRIDARKAITIVEETTLDMALAPEHYNRLRSILTGMEMLADTARLATDQMRAELKSQGVVQ